MNKIRPTGFQGQDSPRVNALEELMRRRNEQQSVAPASEQPEVEMQQEEVMEEVPPAKLPEQTMLQKLFSMQQQDQMPQEQMGDKEFQAIHPGLIELAKMRSMKQG
jgi:hypothetical protein